MHFVGARKRRERLPLGGPLKVFSVEGSLGFLTRLLESLRVPLVVSL